MNLERFIKWAGRVVFFALLATQGGFLSAYPGIYKDSAWYAVVISYVPVVLLWLWFIVQGEAGLRKFVFVWVVYIYCALFPNVVVIFGFVVDDVDNDEFLGPNVLKMVLCITPLLLLLLLTTADFKDNDDDEARWQIVSHLSVSMAIDLLDAVEMLDIVLDQQEHDYGISKGFGIATIVVACSSLLLSPLQMAEIKFEDGKPVKARYKVALIRITVEMIAVNLVSLILRLAVFFKYGKDESIFIAKNGIGIILSCLEIYYCVLSHRKRKTET